MLRIKKEKDLKELEKFGYHKVDNGYQKDYVSEASKKDINLYYNKYKDSNLDNYFYTGISIFIDSKQREINVAIEIYGYSYIQTVFVSCDKEYYLTDLIQAGLVEKVEEKMERLTTKNGGEHYLDLSDSPFSYDEIVCKLGKFEDFMEEQGFESLEQLKEKVDFRKRIDTAPIEKAFREKQKIQDRWETFKKWIYETKPLRGSNLYFLQETLLEKMQELEKE